MWVHFVDADGRCTPHRCASQTHCMLLVDGWGLPRCVHHLGPNRMRCAVYCASAAAAAAGPLAVADPCGRALPPPVLEGVVRWFRAEGHRHAYHVLREATVRPTPNAGSARSPADIGRWCDGTVDALTHYHVRVNLRADPEGQHVTR